VSADSVVITGPRPLRGRLRLPGEKGMSHRALVFGAVAHGATRVRRLAPGEDVARTAAALRQLGVAIEREDDLTTIIGQGFDALRASAAPIDCGNSGTTMRVLSGLLAGRPFRSVLTGDASLAERPMARVVEPLRAMGARIDGRDGGARAPLEIDGAELTGCRIELSTASGQVKTALAVAGLQARGITEIVEPATSRDHTERMLAAIGAPITRVDERTLRVERGEVSAFETDLPGDPSSAAFFVVAAAVTPGSELVLEDVAINPGRIAFLEVLRRMGADIEVTPRAERLGEPVGDVVVRASTLRGTTIECREPFIDEVPALAIAASFAEGVTEFRDAAELRVKESDRVATVAEMLAALGITAEARADGLVVRGGRPVAATVHAHGDHRIALAAAIAANAVSGSSTVDDWSSVAISYPGFLTDLDRLTHVA
jgi:3-phosphoshikimate 1-carboxyvinyltransferase